MSIMSHVEHGRYSGQGGVRVEHSGPDSAHSGYDPAMSRLSGDRICMRIGVMVDVDDRVFVPSIGQSGTVRHIDQQHLFLAYLRPIQVTLDEPYKEGRTYRTDLGDVRKMEGRWWE